MAEGPIFGAGTLSQPLGHTFARGEGFPLWSLGCLHRGSVRLRSRGREALLTAGDCIAIRPGTPYDIRFAGGAAWRETYFLFAPRPDWHDLLDWPELLPGIGRAGARAAEQAELVRAAAWSAAGSARLAANALERALLQVAARTPAYAGLHESVRAALRLLAPGPAEELDVATLAKRVRASPSHFAHLFAQQVGEPPMRFLERRRLERARQLLLGTDRPIRAIAVDCGFADAFRFSTRFRARYGVSPRAYRRDPRR